MVDDEYDCALEDEWTRGDFEYDFRKQMDLEDRERRIREAGDVCF